MADLISRKALIIEMELDEPDSVDENNPEINGMRKEWKHWKKKIKRFPAVDAVEVIRCKDCDQLIYLDDYPAPDYPFCERWQHEVDPEFDYCSKAERKIDACLS